MAGELITQDWQLEYDGWLAGNGTPVGLVSIEGLEDLPDQRGGDHPLAGDDGMFPGRRWLSGRQLVVTFQIEADPAGDLRTVVNDLKRATRKRSGETPLVLRLPMQGVVRLNARPARRALPTDFAFQQGGPRAVVEWVCSDPVLYDNTLRQTDVPAFTAAGGGVSYPVDYPKDYGGATGGGTTTVPNDGDWPTWPRFMISGPSTGVMTVERIENVTDGFDLDFTADTGLTVPAGSALIVETHPARRTVAFTDGASRWNTVAGNEWWPIQPGGAQLRFRASGDIDGATCTVETRDAFL